MTQTNAHIVNHTHWDREWFLTSVYTTPWIAGLVERIRALAGQNPNFRYYLDGQTLVVEDLLNFDPEYRVKIESLIRDGNLSIGPYYCQPDWRLTGGESLLRNLLHGRRDMERHGVRTDTGWLVDTFGHISQAPQLHRLFGIDSVYVWRGVPRLDPYFTWRGADGSELLAIHLFAGYRNLYGVTHVPEIAVKRLRTEVEKLRPFYPTPDIPLFDGYDLEANPEDPVRFFQTLDPGLPEEIQVREATPESFAWLIRREIPDIPAVQGELLSGKYASVFPGTLSTRDYLKVMAGDCEHLLYRVCEPLGAMASLAGRMYPEKKFEAWSRGLLQNAVHDCICGVSIDQVHEKMEFSYRQIFDGMLADVGESLAQILQDFAPDDYAVSTNPFPYEGWHVLRDQLCQVKADGAGVWEIEESLPIWRTGQPVEEFEWKNRYYEARVGQDGTVRVGIATLGLLLVHEERGDTYSGETGRFLGPLRPVGPVVIEQNSERHCVLGLDLSASWDDRRISARLRLAFDPSPLIRWQIDLDSRGSDFRVDGVFAMGHPGQVYAGMPFDVVQRPAIDGDVFPRQLDEKLAAVLLGQRDLVSNRTFPFHDFVAISDPNSSALVFARGLHAYQADENGRITLTLRRAVEWLARPDLSSRVGDAGPIFYVPDARCERSVTHELAFSFVNGGIENPQIQALIAGYHNPPLLVEARTTGTRKSWQVFQESLPLSSMYVDNHRVLARLYNPSTRAQHLSKAYQEIDLIGHPQASIDRIPPEKIVTLVIGETPAASAPDPDAAPVTLLNPPAWRVGQNQGLPDPAIIQLLKDKMHRLERQIEELSLRLDQSEDAGRHHLQHRIYVLEREMLENRLSARLNEIKLAMGGEISYDYLYRPDEEIAALGRQLNQLRIRRRIYDYVVQV